ncbi:hypothetical protein HMPREF2736_11375 [Corynebacterium sp. HMSC036E10]|mgnify:FL=1|nr:hypothetical protein HMPREF3048_02385 [Corynebacterium sp. HMSC075D04]OFU57029.1 hypothetical protein HMPREF3120_03230 [Corynebacterium sp. HMSC11D10]OHO78105.1 hypothetical protein HMPREF2736_11375 [Corynebacterium sp. HMSC036E10]PLA38255.1 hypothetical protein CYJ46_04010 [Corynebacterium coyleae]
MGDSLAEPTWSIEVFDGGNFARFYSRLDEAERTVVEVAIEHVLAPLGIDICASEWGKNLGQGLFELRIRRDIETILREFGAAERVGEVPKRWRRKRVLIRVYCTFYGQRIVLLLGGYNKLRDPSRKQEQKEIRAARSVLSAWKRE